MDELIEQSNRKVSKTSLLFCRSLLDEIDNSPRLVGIKGPRGVGKTTLLLQYIKTRLQPEDKALYVSLDSLWFAENKLYHLADAFMKRGGTHLFLDEVHKYENWAQELKNIYDDFDELKVMFTGSSLLEILNARSDLSRRAIIYNIQGLSFREYIELETKIKFPILSLDTILENKATTIQPILDEIKPLFHFDNYLKRGYYPFYKESESLYQTKIEEIVGLILEIELPLLRGIEVIYIRKIKQLLFLIAESTPFVPNISKLSERIGINRKTLLNYIYYLHEAGILLNLSKEATGISRLQKPDKILLDNPNLAHTLIRYPNEGMICELFFVNQLRTKHVVTYVEKGDFLIDNHFTFEVGGKQKSNKQLEGIANSYIAADNLEYGNGTKIPLWLFGFLY